MHCWSVGIWWWPLWLSNELHEVIADRHAGLARWCDLVLCQYKAPGQCTTRLNTLLKGFISLIKLTINPFKHLYQLFKIFRSQNALISVHVKFGHMWSFVCLHGAAIFVRLGHMPCIQPNGTAFCRHWFRYADDFCHLWRENVQQW